MTKSLKGVYLGLLILSVAGCQKSSITDEVDAKLDKIHQTAVLAPTSLNMDATLLNEDYQGGNDPFVTPFNFEPVSSSDVSNDKIKVLNAGNEAKSTKQTKIDINETSKSTIRYGRPVGVDVTRSRQTLEGYALNTLGYRGRIELDGRISALILSPDGVVHTVQVGNYLGQNHGRITHIDHHEVVVKEAILQEDGRHYERIDHLRFYP